MFIGLIMKKYQKVLEEYLLDPQICKFCSNKNRIYKDYFVPLNVIRYIDKWYEWF
jgi:hypothetical protein